MTKKDRKETAAAKLIKIRKALPSIETLATWGSGPRTFVQRLKRILEG